MTTHTEYVAPELESPEITPEDVEKLEREDIGLQERQLLERVTTLNDRKARKRRSKRLREFTRSLLELDAYERSSWLNPDLPTESKWIGYALSELAFIDSEQVTSHIYAHDFFESVIRHPGFILATHIAKEAAWHYVFVLCRHRGHDTKASAKFADAVMHLFLRRATCPMPWTDEDLLSPCQHEGNVPEPNWPAEGAGGSEPDASDAELVA